MLTIDRTLCTGCGTCVDACLTGAISIDKSEGVAEIDPALCDECMLCVDVCSNEAIQRSESPELIPAEDGEIVEGEIISRQLIPVPEAGSPTMFRQPARLATLAGSALSLVGSWLLPRAADALVEVVERRLTRGGVSALSTTILRSGSQGSMRRIEGGRGGRPRRRQRRRRGR